MPTRGEKKAGDDINKTCLYFIAPEPDVVRSSSRCQKQRLKAKTMPRRSKLSSSVSCEEKGLESKGGALILFCVFVKKK